MPNEKDVKIFQFYFLLENFPDSLSLMTTEKKILY